MMSSSAPLPDKDAILALLIEHLRDHAVFEIDAGGNITVDNRSLMRVFGYGVNGNTETNLTQFYPAHQRDPERMTALIGDALQNGRAEETGLYQRSNGHVFKAQTVLLPVTGANPPRFSVVVRDLSIVLASHEQIHAFATLDALTGLDNRQHVLDLGRVEYRRWRRYRVPMSLVLCEVDHLPEVRQQFGEKMADDILRDVADILRQCVREVDIVARLEEGLFCGLMFSTPLEGACVVAERIRRAVNNAAFKIAQSDHPTATLVVATANDMTEDFDGFLAQVTAALTQAHETGGNRLVVL